jgi:hypothetical protein
MVNNCDSSQLKTSSSITLNDTNCHMPLILIFKTAIYHLTVKRKDSWRTRDFVCGNKSTSNVILFTISNMALQNIQCPQQNEIHVLDINILKI